MEDEALSSISPKKPIVSVAELKKRFPRAAAYITAEGWSRSSNSGKRQAGKKALERIIAGENHEQVLADMEAEWNAYTKQRYMGLTQSDSPSGLVMAARSQAQASQKRRREKCQY